MQVHSPSLSSLSSFSWFNVSNMSFCTFAGAASPALGVYFVSSELPISSGSTSEFFASPSICRPCNIVHFHILSRLVFCLFCSTVRSSTNGRLMSATASFEAISSKHVACSESRLAPRANTRERALRKAWYPLASLTNTFA